MTHRLLAVGLMAASPFCHMEFLVILAVALWRH